MLLYYITLEDFAYLQFLTALGFVLADMAEL